ncbi:TetR/AcrR family transcriptional regulator [Nocardia sp. BMG111209]|uniref:TetR/AcrR family transcriptional regulator n=1 Tax=Nocardia sp. BMG111209 TaxID=1160137 RepID=UPI00036B9FC7|nr:TetR family transcriptional regulator [Nocardia sp. BMG111209]
MSEDTPRARLLRRGEQLLAERGRLSDLTLRKLAEHLGTSHRMLIHHFGSRDGFLAALLSELRRHEQRTLRALATRDDYDDALRMLERLYLDPAHRPRIAAFFYVLGLAVQDPAAYGEFLESLEDWTTLVTTLGERSGLPAEEARARAVALVWAARGLFVTALTGDDGAAAFAEFRAVVRVLAP